MSEIGLLTTVALVITGILVIGGLALSIFAVIGASMESAARREYKRRRL